LLLPVFYLKKDILALLTLPPCVSSHPLRRFPCSGFQDVVFNYSPALPTCRTYLPARPTADSGPSHHSQPYTHLDLVRDNQSYLFNLIMELSLFISLSSQRLPCTLDHPSGSPHHFLFNKPHFNSTPVVTASALGSFCQSARH